MWISYTKVFHCWINLKLNISHCFQPIWTLWNPYCFSVINLNCIKSVLFSVIKFKTKIPHYFFCKFAHKNSVVFFKCWKRIRTVIFQFVTEKFLTCKKYVNNQNKLKLMISIDPSKGHLKLLVESGHSKNQTSTKI